MAKKPVAKYVKENNKEEWWGYGIVGGWFRELFFLFPILPFVGCLHIARTLNFLALPLGSIHRLWGMKRLAQGYAYLNICTRGGSGPSASSVNRIGMKLSPPPSPKNVPLMLNCNQANVRQGLSTRRLSSSTSTTPGDSVSPLVSSNLPAHFQPTSGQTSPRVKLATHD